MITLMAADTAPILVVDDDPKIVTLVRMYLERERYPVVTAGDGRTALRLIEEAAPRLVVLDLMIPEIDGLAVIRRARELGDVPILVLSARSAVGDRILGLTEGADDYLPKPFDVLELIARVEVLARRGRLVVATAATDLVLDPARHSVSCNGREAMLTPTEFRMLAAITSRPGEVVRRRAVVAAAWPQGGMVSDNTVDSYVRRIRVKLAEVDSPLKLMTVRGVGYTLR
jgi:DNA-binding response OmpR family regulator